MDRLGLYEELKKITQNLSKELDEQKELQRRLGQRIEEINQLSIKNAIRYALDIQQIETEASQAEINTRFAKTAGNNEALNKNTGHEFARKMTMLHIKSNSVVTWIPKNACSNIRYSIAEDNGAISSIKDIEWIHKNNHTFNASNKELLQAKYSFVILRNPFKRLLSFYLDKICHVDESGNDTSYNDAKGTFDTDDNTTFEDFIETIHLEPMRISKDIHTRPQCDFMIYKKYCNYYSVERIGEAIESIYKRTGLKIKDIRSKNSIFTTQGKEKTDVLTNKSRAKTIREAMKDNMSPISERMYTAEMIGKVSSIYLPDIMLYHCEAPDSQNELKTWMHQLASLNN